MSKRFLFSSGDVLGGAQKRDLKGRLNLVKSELRCVLPALSNQYICPYWLEIPLVIAWNLKNRGENYVD